MDSAKISVPPGEPIGTISPRLYGHFAEHLGRCCYDGLWAQGEDATGWNFRPDVAAALRAMPTPLLRWPGGCYADHYHWRDGIGPPDSRPRRLGMSCGLTVEDDNSLGTHEFLRLCSLIGAEPYLAANVGTGTPQEMCDWLEYCNSTLDTTLTRERAAHGSREPFGVKLWGVGNENWGCGGCFDAADYAREYRRYASMLRHVDPTAELVICGFEDDWNRTLLAEMKGHTGLINHLSIHSYWLNGGPEERFGEEEYYMLLEEADATEAFVKRTAAMAHEAAGGRRIGIALDEWGVWHPEARTFGPREVEARQPVTFEQASTMRDAVAAAIALEGFHRQCRDLTLANLAQVVNILHAPVMTRGASMWVTPTYHVFRLHAPHLGALAREVETHGSPRLPGGGQAISATASVRGEGAGSATAVTIINRHMGRTIDVTIDLARTAALTQAGLLAAPEPSAGNSPEHPDAVRIVEPEVSSTGTEWRITMPPAAVATLQYRTT